MCKSKSCTFSRCSFVILLFFVVDAFAIPLKIEVYRGYESTLECLGTLGVLVADNTPLWRYCCGDISNTVDSFSRTQH